MVNSENDLPSSYALLSPGNTTMVTDLTPELHWEEPTDPDLQGSIASYSVYVSTDNSFADVTPEAVATNTLTISTDLISNVKRTGIIIVIALFLISISKNFQIAVIHKNKQNNIDSVIDAKQ